MQGSEARGEVSPLFWSRLPVLTTITMTRRKRRGKRRKR
jgi:hypothetical protein